ncbi:MAG: LytR family transcriptional regulator [Ruminococcaceae bacterium]|nr:LytR family transcriptional regulator [Oscillospiraceae bacterium]
MSDSVNNNDSFDFFLDKMRHAEHAAEHTEPNVVADANADVQNEPAENKTAESEPATEVETGKEEQNTQQESTVEQGEAAIYADPVNPKKKRKAGKVLLAVVIVLAVLVGGGYFALHSFFDQFSYVPMEEQTGMSADTTQGKIEEPTMIIENPELSLADEEYDTLIELLDANAAGNSIVLSDENVWNVLLIGADESLAEGTARSDSMILVSVSHYTDTIVLTSILRDSYIKIPDNGYNRINAALPYGGVSLLAETIESNFGIHVDNYAMLDFALFKDVIDAIGGVYLTPTEDETEYINELMVLLDREDLLIETPNELTQFNGVQALYYARIRKMDSDVHRTERQRKLLLAAKDRVLSMDLTQLLDLVKEFMPRIVTDIDSKTCISLLFSAYKMLQEYNIEQHCIPMEGTYSDTYVYGMSVKRIYDFESNTETWEELVYGDNEPVAAEPRPTELPTDESGNDVIFTEE